MFLYPAASISWPLVWTTKFRCGPYSVPVGRLTFAVETACAISSIPICREASCVGSTSIRTANFCAPKTLTPATPLTIESRCASTDSAYSSSFDSGIVFELSVRKRMG